MSDQSDQPRWLVKLDGSSRDIDAVKRNFSAGVLDIEDIGDERFLSAPRFAGCNSAREVEAEAAELLANVNVAMSIAPGTYSGLSIGGVVERTATGLNRTMFAKTGFYSIVGGTATAYVTGPDGRIVSGGPPPRSFEERLTDIMDRDDRVREAALALATKPTRWGDLNLAYETIKGLMSPKGKRDDWPTLVNLGWLTVEESNRFYATAGHYRHGHPRAPIKHLPEMPLDDATKLVKRLLQRMVDHLQPD